jgi:hemoglobin-like flavoprotein
LIDPHVDAYGEVVPTDVELVRESFELAAAREPALVEDFYRRLFARAPELEPMFHRPRAEQAAMLRAALIAVVDHLEDATWLTANVAALGVRHRGYGVTPPMYAHVGAALLDALAAACGEAWTPAHAAAWTKAYRHLSELMIASAAGAAA